MAANLNPILFYLWLRNCKNSTKHNAPSCIDNLNWWLVEKSWIKCNKCDKTYMLNYHQTLAKPQWYENTNSGIFIWKLLIQFIYVYKNRFTGGFSSAMQCLNAFFIVSLKICWTNSPKLLAICDAHLTSHCNISYIIRLSCYPRFFPVMTPDSAGYIFGKPQTPPINHSILLS